MNLEFVDYVVEPLSGGSPNIVAIPSAVIGIYTDGLVFDNTDWDVYTSFDGVALLLLDALTITLDESMMWVPGTNAEWYKIRCAGPYFAIDPQGLDETQQHNFKLVCRGSI